MALLGLAIQLGITGALWAIDKYILDDGAGAYKKPRPQGLEFTQATIGDPVPLVYGTARVDSPVLVWDGRHDTTDYGGGDFLYHVAMLLVAGVPPWGKYNDPDNPASEVAPFTTWRTLWPVKWKRFWWGDIEILDGTELEHGDIVDPINTSFPSGGDIEIRVEFFDGRADQVITSYPAATSDPALGPGTTVIDWLMDLASVVRSDIPGYRHQMLCVIDGSEHPTTPAQNFTVGRSNVIPQLGIEVQALGPEPIGIDANPAWILWDLICSPVWKIGYDQTRIDLTSFRAAATTLLNEVHGMSLVIYQQEDAGHVIRGILEQIDGVLFEDPTTGKLKLKLIRQDYVVAALPTMNMDNTIGRPEVSILGWGDRVNNVYVTYTDRSKDYEKERMPAFRLGTDGGAIARLNTQEIEFTGCMTEALAEVLADRELAQLSRPYTTVNAKLNREFYELLPGDAVRAYWPPYNIIDKVFRVLSVDYGQLADGEIAVTLVEDVLAPNQVAVPPWGGGLAP